MHIDGNDATGTGDDGAKQAREADTAEANQRRVSEEILLAWAKVETCESLDECRKVLDELNAPPADG